MTSDDPMTKLLFSNFLPGPPPDGGIRPLRRRTRPRCPAHAARTPRRGASLVSAGRGACPGRGDRGASSRSTSSRGSLDSNVVHVLSLGARARPREATAGGDEAVEYFNRRAVASLG